MNKPIRPPPLPVTRPSMAAMQPSRPEQATMDLILHEVRRGNERTTRVEQAVDDLKGEMAELSGRVMRNSSMSRQPSEHDLAASAELARERAAREAIEERLVRVETKTDEQTQMLSDIKSAVMGTIQSPKVRFVGKVLWGAAVAYAVAKGVHVLP